MATTVIGMDVWVTSAVADELVSKALMLAGSLYRVRTSKKLVVFTAKSVSKDLRDKLAMTFDLVVVLEQDLPEGLDLEEYFKKECYSLIVHNKCVYLSPTTLVLKNCDEIFDKYEEFAALANEHVMDTSAFILAPPIGHNLEVQKRLMPGELNQDGSDISFGEKSCKVVKGFNLWIQEAFPSLKKLDEEYYFTFDLDFEIPERFYSESTMAIVNFVDTHPLDLIGDGNFGKLTDLGTIYVAIAELCQRIYDECLNPGPIDEEFAEAMQLSSLIRAKMVTVEELREISWNPRRLPAGPTPMEQQEVLCQGGRLGKRGTKNKKRSSGSVEDKTALAEAGALFATEIKNGAKALLDMTIESKNEEELFSKLDIISHLRDCTDKMMGLLLSSADVPDAKHARYTAGNDEDDEHS